MHFSLLFVSWTKRPSHSHTSRQLHKNATLHSPKILRGPFHYNNKSESIQQLWWAGMCATFLNRIFNIHLYYIIHFGWFLISNNCWNMFLYRSPHQKHIHFATIWQRYRQKKPSASILLEELKCYVQIASITWIQSST